MKNLLLVIILHFLLDLLTSFPSELFWNYGSYRQLVGLLGRVIKPVERPLPTQDNTNIEEKRTDIYDLSGIQIHDPND
jgi:hypothetical protein